MDNMELILQELQKINGRLDSVEEKLDQLMEEHSMTREGVNTLLDWADNVAIEVKIPLKPAN